MRVNLQKAEFILSAASPKDFRRDALPQVAFAGRSNVGKSSVINRLLNRKNFARVGAMPGKTIHINYFKVDGAFYLVDLPGYGYAKVSDAEKRRWKGLIEGYLEADRELCLVVQLLDARHAPSADDRTMLDYLVQREIPFLVVLTKMDKLNVTQRVQRLQAFQEEFASLEGLTVVPFSAVTGEGTQELRKILTEIAEG